MSKPSQKDAETIAAVKTLLLNLQTENARLRQALANAKPLLEFPQAGESLFAATGTTSLKVFIVGCPRSGTSAMCHAARSVLGLPGMGESHIVPVIQRISVMLNTYVGQTTANAPLPILLKHLNGEDFEEHVFRYFRDFYRRAYRGDRWVDKTPSIDAILGIPLVLKMFPDAKTILMRRHGIEMVQSFRLKFGAEFAQACRVWARTAEAILHMRSQKTEMLEVDQFDMSNHAGRVAQAVTGFLGVPEQLDAFSRFFSESRIEKLSTHDWRKHLTLDDVDWRPNQKVMFRNVCGALMTELGYQF